MRRVVFFLFAAAAISSCVWATASAAERSGELEFQGWRPASPRSEIHPAFAVAPGHQLPVFDTPLGKIGMMICFDVHMPEVARGLAANGAEIIAPPIMGGDPNLARAHVIENQVCLVTSTYSVNDDWMQTGVWGLDGNLLVRATKKDTVVVAEVDLSKQHFWRGNMGDFKSRLRHERPIIQLPK